MKNKVNKAVQSQKIKAKVMFSEANSRNKNITSCWTCSHSFCSRVSPVDINSNIILGSSSMSVSRCSLRASICAPWDSIRLLSFSSVNGISPCCCDDVQQSSRLRNWSVTCDTSHYKNTITKRIQIQPYKVSNGSHDSYHFNNLWRRFMLHFSRQRTWKGFK